MTDPIEPLPPQKPEKIEFAQSYKLGVSAAGRAEIEKKKMALETAEIIAEMEAIVDKRVRETGSILPEGTEIELPLELRFDPKRGNRAKKAKREPRPAPNLSDWLNNLNWKRALIAFPVMLALFAFATALFQAVVPLLLIFVGCVIIPGYLVARFAPARWIDARNASLWILRIIGLAK